MSVEEEFLYFSGRAVKTQLSEKSLNNSILLIMTTKRKVISIWSLTDSLELNKLVEGGLDERSFFGFVEVGGLLLDPKSEQATQTALICSSGEFFKNVRSLSLYLPKAGIFEKVKTFKIGGQSSLNFHQAEILAIKPVMTESGINLVLIAQGGWIKTSVIVLDSQMNPKLLT